MEFTPSNTKLKNVGGGEKGGERGGRHIYFAFIYGFEIIPWHLHLPIHTLLSSKGENHQPEVACCVTIYPLWWY
jgi:hypothetical protein